MIADIVGISTRADAGLVNPRSRSNNITPERGGACGHWGGTFQRLGSHDRCLAIWASWQAFHMRPGGLGTRDGAADIAYNFGYCNHGYILVGRGWGVRSGANGSSAGNQNFYAFVWVGGSGDGHPNSLALNAFAWLVAEGRRRGMGRDVRPHSYFTGSHCPGDFLRREISGLHRQEVALPAPPAPSPTLDSRAIIIVRRGSQFHLRRALSGGAADDSFHFGVESDLPVAGDWNRSGRDTIGVFRRGRWLLRNSFSGGPAELDIPYGRAGDVPLVGDWTGNGRRTIGIRRGSTFHLRNEVMSGPADTTFNFGRIDDIPLVGDWNGDGRDTVGVFRRGQFYLVNDLRGGAADISFQYGREGDIPVVGDWFGGGADRVGVYRNGRFFLKADLRGGSADAEFSYGRSGDEPIVVRYP